VLAMPPCRFSCRPPSLARFTDDCAASCSGTRGSSGDGRRSKAEPKTDVLPTPTATRFGYNCRWVDGVPGKVRPSLPWLIARGRLPAPATTEAARGNRRRDDSSPRAGDGTTTFVGGPLNPRFLEALMGFPSDWTRVTDARANELWATRSSPRARRPRGARPGRMSSAE
jgi:hypothetical protein